MSDRSVSRFLWSALGVIGLGLAIGWWLPESGEARAESAPVRRAQGWVAPAPRALVEAGPDRELGRRLEALLAEGRREAEVAGQGKLRAAQVEIALSVRERASGRELVAVDADAALRPASNLKLVTTATALTLLGPDWQFETFAQAQGALTEGVLAGDLVLRAAGDPLYAPDGSGAMEPRLADLAAELCAAGLRQVRGALVLDEGSFADPAPGPAWPPQSQHWTDYCALAAGFSANGGILCARVLPGAAGGAAQVAVHPWPTGLSSDIGVQTLAGHAHDVRVGASARGLVVRGTLGVATGALDASFSHPDPVGLFAAVLLDQLQRAGIEVAGGARRERGRFRPELPALAALRSPLSQYLPPINAESTNSLADQVFLACALASTGRATREDGRAATVLALRRLGVPSTGLVQVDGSGLSRDNRVSARQVSALLCGVLALPAGASQPFVDSLAVAGQSGTLEKRPMSPAARGRVYAKTGFIAGTSALSGLALALDGREYVFSILVNYPDLDGINNRAFKPMQDRIAAALVEYAP